MWKLGSIVGLALICAYLIDSAETARHAKQAAWECRPQPGYCDIDSDWRSPVKKHLEHP